MENNGASNKPVVQKNDMNKGGDAGKTDWKQWGIAAAVALVVVVGGYFLVNSAAKAPSEAENDETALEDESAIAEAGPGPSFRWAFTPAGGNGDTGAYQYQVTLAVDGEEHDMGTFAGPCVVIGDPTTWALQPGELTGVICYFAGAGSEVGVFYENGSYVVKKGTLEEGSEEEPGTRGGYENVFVI